MAKKVKKDALERVREMVELNDEFQSQLNDARRDAIALAEELYPEQVEDDREFEHKGAYYQVKHLRRWDFTHVTSDPIFREWRRIVGEQKGLKKEYDRVMRKIRRRFPHLKPKSETKTIKVMRAKASKEKEKKQK